MAFQLDAVKCRLRATCLVGGAVRAAIDAIALAFQRIAGDSAGNTADRCANTPAGTAVDATGCPRDSDRDGVLDLLF